MSQIRSDILYQRRRKEVIQTNEQMKRLHIATPIVPDDNDDIDLEIINDDESVIVSDCDYIDDNDNNNIVKDKNDELEPNTEEIENQWQTIISEWIKETNYENQVENN